MRLKRVLAAVMGVGLGSTVAAAQAYSTASRPFDFQAGVGYSSANANYEYVHNRIHGFAAYADFDFRAHLGIEAEFHNVSDKNTTVSQKTYEIGARSEFQFGRIDPYGKVMYGRGTQNFPANVATLSYNLFAAGAGVDFVAAKRVKLRVEYEYQDWLNAPGPGLSMKPQIITIGIAYHLPVGEPGRRR
jgi:opacity protein-like surface antigen